MNYKNKSYGPINILFLGIAFALLIILALRNGILDLNGKELKYQLKILLLFAAFFFVLHIVKMFRFYILMMEQNILFHRFVRLYIKTTFVNILLPFKFGELYRFYCYSYDTKNYKVGLLGIVMERFFDTCTLLMLLVPMEFFYGGRLSALSGIMIGILAILYLAYMVIPSICEYMNRFFIFKVRGKKSITFLKMLETMQEWYLYAKGLIRGRAPFVFVLSIVAWLIEYGMYYLVASMLKVESVASKFSNYINAGFGRGNDSVLVLYTVGGSIVFGIVLVIVYFTNIGKKDNYGA